MNKFKNGWYREADSLVNKMPFSNNERLVINVLLEEMSNDFKMGNSIQAIKRFTLFLDILVGFIEAGSLNDLTNQSKQDLLNYITLSKSYASRFIP